LEVVLDGHSWQIAEMSVQGFGVLGPSSISPGSLHHVTFTIDRCFSVTVPVRAVAPYGDGQHATLQRFVFAGADPAVADLLIAVASHKMGSVESQLEPM